MEPMTIMAGISVAQSLLGSSQDDTQWKEQSRKAGQDRANVEATRNRALAELPAKVKAESDAALKAATDAQQQGDAAVASATVQAAASGATGANVDQTIQTVEGNAARVQQTIADAKRGAMLQIESDHNDIMLEADAQTPSLNIQGSGTSMFQRLGAAGLAGASSYYGAQL